MKCWGAILAVIFVISTSSVVIADTEDGNEVGVEWTNTYGFYYGDPDEGTIYLPNLQYNDDLVVGFYNILGQDGFKEVQPGGRFGMGKTFQESGPRRDGFQLDGRCRFRGLFWARESDGVLFQQRS